jgi:hypothetical protein
MIMKGKWRLIGAGLTLAIATIGAVAAEAVAPAESRRMSRAKDFIADEQWVRAVEELRAAADDPKEPAKDEALFWLAHSQNQAGDRAAAVETIHRLEQRYPRSRWTKPARSLRIEIAQRLRRNDVLWYTATPPPPPAPPPAVAPEAPPAVPVRPALPRHPPRARPPAPTPLPPEPAEPSAATPPTPALPPMPPPELWFGAEMQMDTDLRIQALGSLMKTDAPKVIPMLKAIAMESDNQGAARRALFVLAQSGRADARSTVVEVARTAPEPIRIAAIRELGRFGGANVGRELLQVYSTGNALVKHQVVMSLGESLEVGALLRIVESEVDRTLRERAILTLGRAGGREQLRRLYAKASRSSKRAIIAGLFNARAEAELRQIAEEERNAALRREAQIRLRLLGASPASKRERKKP